MTVSESSLESEASAPEEWPDDPPRGVRGSLQAATFRRLATNRQPGFANATALIAAKAKYRIWRISTAQPAPTTRSESAKGHSTHSALVTPTPRSGACHHPRTAVRRLGAEQAEQTSKQGRFGGASIFRRQSESKTLLASTHLVYSLITSQARSDGAGGKEVEDGHGRLSMSLHQCRGCLVGVYYVPGEIIRGSLPHDVACPGRQGFGFPFAM